MTKLSFSNLKGSFELKLKSFFACYTSYFDEVKELSRHKSNSFSKQIFKWNILKKHLSRNKLQQKNIDLIVESFKNIRNYNSHSYHCSILDSLEKGWSLIFTLVDQTKLQNLDINTIFTDLFKFVNSDKKERPKKAFQAKWLVLLFYSSLILYRSDFTYLENQVLTILKNEKLSSTKEDFLDVDQYTQRFKKIIKIDRLSYLDEDQQSNNVWAANSMLQQLYPHKNNEISLNWYVVFWEKFLLDDAFNKEHKINFRLRHFYSCPSHVSDNSVNSERIDRKQSEQLSRLERDQLFCYQCGNKNKYPYQLNRKEYLIKNRIFWFEVNGSLFKISLKPMKHFLLQTLLEIKEGSKICTSRLKEKFKEFLNKCNPDNSDLALLNSFVKTDSVVINSKKHPLFENRIFVKKYVLKNSNSDFNNTKFEPWNPLQTPYSFQTFWKNRCDFRINKLQQKLKLVKNYSNSYLDDKQSVLNSVEELPFKILIQKFLQKQNESNYSEEIRKRLSFVFKTVNSVFLSGALQSTDFDKLFKLSFQHINRSSENFNLFDDLEEEVFKKIPRLFRSFSVEDFDRCFIELIEKKIGMIRTECQRLEKEHQTLGKDKLKSSILKFDKNRSFFKNPIKINYFWLKQFCFSQKDKHRTLLDCFTEKLKNEELVDFYRSSSTSEIDSTEIQNKLHSSEKKDWNFKSLFALKYCLQLYFKNHFLHPSPEKIKTREIQFVFEDKPSTPFNLFRTQIKYCVSAEKKIFITFKNLRDFRWDLLCLYRLDTFDRGGEMFEFLIKEYGKREFSFSELKERLKFVVSDKDNKLTYSWVFLQILYLEKKHCRKNGDFYKKKGYRYSKLSECLPENDNKTPLIELRNKIMHRELLNQTWIKKIYQIFGEAIKLRRADKKKSLLISQQTKIRI